jgi:hypothetical protein
MNELDLKNRPSTRERREREREIPIDLGGCDEKDNGSTIWR